jgi:hypothetical protein
VKPQHCLLNEVLRVLSRPPLSPKEFEQTFKIRGTRRLERASRGARQDADLTQERAAELLGRSKDVVVNSRTTVVIWGLPTLSCLRRK